jgi:hypothetical protein
VPRKHHFPPSFPAFRSTAPQLLQSMFTVYRSLKPTCEDHVSSPIAFP